MIDGKKIVLVIDDDADILNISAMKLERAGFAVETADSAIAGARVADRIKPDLILLDINMPGLNGTQEFLDLKNSKAMKDVPIAFFTNLTHPWPGLSGDHDKDAKELGAVAFIDKSRDLNTLDEVVKNILASL